MKRIKEKDKKKKKPNKHVQQQIPYYTLTLHNT